MKIRDLQLQLDLGLTSGLLDPENDLYLIIRKNSEPLIQEIVPITNLLLPRVEINPDAIIEVRDAQITFTRGQMSS